MHFSFPLWWAQTCLGEATGQKSRKCFGHLFSPASSSLVLVFGFGNSANQLSAMHCLVGPGGVAMNSFSNAIARGRSLQFFRQLKTLPYPALSALGPSTKLLGRSSRWLTSLPTTMVFLLSSLPHILKDSNISRTRSHCRNWRHRPPETRRVHSYRDR